MRKINLSLASLLFYCLAYAQPSADKHVFQLETSEVANPTLSLSPNGKEIVFNLLGHLFTLPVTGGAAKQITFGAYYDSEPVFSPDGLRMAFVSNRDGSDGNLFVLELASGKISKLTDEFQVSLPTWSPDGKKLSYLAMLKREEYPKEMVPGFGSGDRGYISTVPSAGGQATRVNSSPLSISSIFYLTDGRLAWMKLERHGPPWPDMPGMAPQPMTTHIETQMPDGSVSKLGTLKGKAARPAYVPSANRFYYALSGKLWKHNVTDTASAEVMPLTGGGLTLSVIADEKYLLVGADAHLWQMTVADKKKEKIEWSATVKMEVNKPSRKEWKADNLQERQPLAVLTPRLSPDGKKIVFVAAGSIWLQPTAGGKATRLLDDRSYQVDPAFSPDGSRLAFVSDKYGKREVRVFNLATGQVNTVASVGGYAWVLQPVWSRDGKKILYQQSGALGAPYEFFEMDATAGSNAVSKGKTSGNWNARPHYSADGSALYYTARQGMIANVFRKALADESTAKAITDLKRHAHDALVSPDGKWIALRRNSEIWMAPLTDKVLKDEDFSLFSSVGGRSFAFTPDGHAMIFSEGSNVWTQSLSTGAQPVRLAVNHTLPAFVGNPVLLNDVHVLNFTSGKFSEPTSILIQEGKIRWIGSASGHPLPQGVQVIAGQGRYVIPGLTDSHTHTAWSNQQITEDRLIAYGVTSVRDVGSRLDVINNLRDRGYTTNLPVPRYFASGDIFEGLIPLWGDAFFEITTREEARQYVKSAKENGADFIKVYASLPWFAKEEVAAEARRQGMPVVGHGLSVEEITRSVNFGITSLEHGGPNSDDIVKLLAHTGRWLDPTPTIFGAGTTIRLADSATFDWKFKTFIPEDELKAAYPGRKPSAQQLAGWKNTLANIKRIHDNQVKLLDGTDALMTGVFHGPSVHWVLQFFTEAGIPAIDVLRLATLGAAQSVGASRELGSVETGKLADLLILEADPLQDISNTMKIWRVIKNGEMFDPAALRK
ncbi:MAG: PD40 domain-containing protein [Bacteroidetes bacterium]|nr:PD40 domain-containing protein [Bacteroidota bacterium]MBS1540970.1 PD40 domain-containing protein [Bacteroidota bacterium]